MGDFFKRLFDSDLMPHGHCWQWEPWIVWTNVLADGVIALCYLVIPLALVSLVHRRKDVLFNPLVMLFGAFIFSCGCTHSMEVYNTWHGVYRLAGLLKMLTAVVSVMTVVPLLRVFPKLLAVPALSEVLAMDAALSSGRQEEQRMAKQLRVSQDRFRLLVESVKDYSIILLDPEGRITSWNPGAERITGYPEREILGQPYAQFFPEEDVAAGKPAEILRRAATLGRTENEGDRVRKDGSHYITNAVITSFFDAEGALDGFAAVARDITQQKANQAAMASLAENLEDQVKARVQELRESEAKLQGFIRHAPAGIAFKGLDGRFLLINPRMEARLGYPSEKILGRTLQDLFPPAISTPLLRGERRVIEFGEESQEEEQWPQADGSTRHFLCTKFPLVDGTGQYWGLGIIATDITERKQAEQAQIQSQKLESLGVLAGGIAHDFNNLLGAMQGNVELAMTEDSMELARPYHETLRRLMAKAGDLLRQMLAYSGQGRPRGRILNLNPLIEEMTQLLSASISKKALIHLELNPRLAPMLADPSQLQQVVMNLVINASEALGEQNGVITIRTGMEELTQATIDGRREGHSLRPGPYVALEVVDTGAGMTPEVLKKIFDPFFTTKFTGRGLGLAAIHGIVREHHGAIKVVSEPGQGTTFKLLFPATLGVAPAEAPACLLNQPQASQTSIPGMILVVDDEEAMRAVVTGALGRAGFQTLVARDGTQALELYQSHRDQIRLILMDLTMPNLDGAETCRELRRSGALVPVILTSGFNEAEALGHCQGLELAGFIQKPFELGALLELVRRTLA